MKTIKLPILFLLSLTFTLLASGQSPQASRNCGKITPTSSIRAKGDSPCSDTRFFFDDDFSAAQGTPSVVKLSIDRFVGNPTLLKENGFIKPKSKLRLAVKGETRGQLSSIRVNGNILNPSFFLNGDWKLLEFDVPVEFINFPKTPLDKAENEIQIDLIAGSLVGDWVSLEIEVAPPVLLIHGIFSGPETWSNWFGKDGMLGKTGIPVETIDVGDAGSMAINAAKISERINELKDIWKVDKITLIGHSKGGLDARFFAEKSNSVSKVIMIGTPNEGSPIADVLTEILSNKWIGRRFLDWNVGLKELSPQSMIEFNKNHKPNPKIEYIAIAGDFTPTCKPDKTKPDKKCEINLALNSMIGKGDLLVSLDSVYSLPYAKNLPPINSVSDVGCEYIDSAEVNNSKCEATHTNLLRSEKLFQALLPYIGKPISN